jgi:hypothetical protein
MVKSFIALATGAGQRLVAKLAGYVTAYFNIQLLSHFYYDWLPLVMNFGSEWLE